MQDHTESVKSLLTFNSVRSIELKRDMRSPRGFLLPVFLEKLVCCGRETSRLVLKRGDCLVSGSGYNDRKFHALPLSPSTSVARACVGLPRHSRFLWPVFRRFKMIPCFFARFFWSGKNNIVVGSLILFGLRFLDVLICLHIFLLKVSFCFYAICYFFLHLTQHLFLFAKFFVSN